MRKVKSATEEKTGTVIQITRDNLSGDYNITEPGTKTEVEELEKLTDNGVRLKLGKTQLFSGTPITMSSGVELVFAPDERKKNKY